MFYFCKGNGQIFTQIGAFLFVISKLTKKLTTFVVFLKCFVGQWNAAYLHIVTETSKFLLKWARFYSSLSHYNVAFRDIFRLQRPFSF